MNPAFPNLPEAVPLTYTLAVHACLSSAPNERPNFEQVCAHAYDMMPVSLHKLQLLQIASCGVHVAVTLPPMEMQVPHACGAYVAGCTVAR